MKYLLFILLFAGIEAQAQTLLERMLAKQLRCALITSDGKFLLSDSLGIILASNCKDTLAMPFDEDNIISYPAPVVFSIYDDEEHHNDDAPAPRRSEEIDELEYRD